MLTEKRMKSALLDELQNLPEVEYPAEVMDRWAKISEIAVIKSNRGELKPFAAFAAEIGYKY